MLRLWRNRGGHPTLNAIQKLNGQRGPGARVAVWLLREFGFHEGRPIDLQAADAAIAAAFGVSVTTAIRWRRGALPAMRHLEEMRARWGLRFVVDLFSDPTPEQSEVLREIEEAMAALAEKRRRHLDSVGAGEGSLYQMMAEPGERAARLFARLIQATAEADRSRAGLGRVFRRLAGEGV